MSCCGRNTSYFDQNMDPLPKKESYTPPADKQRVRVQTFSSVPQTNRLRMRENYTPCCRPQPYVGLEQTWALQKRFDS